MDNIEYDIVKLKSFCEIDVKSAIRNFGSYQEYFYELNKFVNASKHYLQNYVPSMIISDEDIRRDFLADVNRIWSNLISLGIIYPASTLTELKYEAYSGSSKSLTKWLIKFFTEIENMAKSIASSRIISEVVPQNTEKTVILAVDDKPELLTAVVNMLEDKFKVMAAINGKSALKIIEKHTPELFLLDIEMPQMDGYKLAELIRKRSGFEQTPIIFLTGKNTREDVISAIKNGGNDYILKPVNKDLLLSKILHYLEGI